MAYGSMKGMSSLKTPVKSNMKLSGKRKMGSMKMSSAKRKM